MLRVPEITAYFWIIKGLSTALGEAASGASIADWLGKPYLGGLGLGDGRVSLVLAAMILALVAYLAVTRKDVPG
jgi:uncharacterized membrane-anchored protein